MSLPANARLDRASLALIEEILGAWKDVIGADYRAYGNHVQRMVTFCFALRACSAQEREQVVIAACFHDIGIWTAHTLDYLPPSLPPALAYLESRGKAHWAPVVSLMISEHHKLRPYRDPRYPLVEAFRKADLVDFSLGLFRAGLPRTLVRAVRAQTPNAGFHRRLLQLALRWFVRHPLNPAPMMKW